MFETQLIALGFSVKESAVYMALNQYGPSPASTLARLTNIKRTSMYDILNSLLEKNVIISFKQGQYTYFAIDDIQKILHMEKEKVNIAKSLVSQLKENQKNLTGMQVNYYRGIEGYKEINDDILKAHPKEILVWMHLENFHEVLDSEYVTWWTQERIAQKIRGRLLLQDTPLARQFKANSKGTYRDIRLVPKKHMFQTTSMIYDDHITLFDSEKNITGIRIHHPALYQMFKQIFEMNWELFSASS